MEKKIVSLLNNNLRVIIPDLGAFIIRQQEPRIVVFNELLKNNDCLLIDHIMKTENVEADVAQQLLSDYTSQVFRTLDSGGTVTIDGIGSLRKNSKGKLSFTPENEILTIEPEPIIQTVTEDQLPFDRIEKPAADTSIPAFSLKSFLNTSAAKWIAIFLAANVIVFAFFVLKDPLSNAMKSKKPATRLKESVLNQLADSMMAAVKDSTVLLNAGSDIPISNDNILEGNFRYYIVAGCFRDEINADELVDSLQNAGYKSEKFGKIGDLYAVSFASFDDKDLAVKELDRIRKEFHPDAWMTRF